MVEATYKNARVVSVIMVTDGDVQTYFTQEGVEIGSLHGGHQKKPIGSFPPIDKPKGGIVTSLTPQQVKHEQDKQADRDLTLEERLKHERERAV